ncbi:MAG: hypothetical protein U9R10_02920, partial [Euryarchaeota archaeon]|nr:hypothetical protein [Euryarchaeota archaeon]
MEKEMKSIAVGMVVLAVFFGMIAPVQAQTYQVWGYVFDSDGTTPVVGATVNTTDVTNGAMSNTTSLEGGAYQATYGPPATEVVNIGDTFQIVATFGDKTNTTTITATGSPQQVNVILDGGAPGPTIESYTISNSTITPPQTTEIDVEFSETVSYLIAIESETSTVYDWTGDAKNPEAKVWNGTYKADGTVVPAGDYTVNVTGTNTTTEQSVTDTSKVIKVERDENYGVDLSVDIPSQTVKPDEIATYTLTVENTGDMMDNYTLDIVNKDNATVVSLSKDAIANLGAGESEDVLLNVSD